MTPKAIILKSQSFIGLTVMALLALVVAACSTSAETEPTPTQAARPATATPAGTTPTSTPRPASTTSPIPSTLQGTIEIDGSSTVFPIAEAVAEEFRKVHPNVRVNVGISGTGGGFKRFAAGETDISNASRPISSSEMQQATQNSIAYMELKVGIDGLAVMVNRDNSFISCITAAELKKIWDAGSTVSRWNEVRPEWPDQPLRLYGPGTDSGTFDYFTEVINGKAKQSRPDYTASEDDNVLVQGIAGDRNSLGYFGYAYYAENTDKLKVLAIDKGQGCITPAAQTVGDGTYPLSRPLFIYVKQKSLERPEVKAFAQFFMQTGEKLVAEVGYVSFPASLYQQQLGLIK